MMDRKILTTILLSMLVFGTIDLTAQEWDWRKRSGRDVNKATGAAWVTVTNNPGFGSRMDHSAVPFGERMYVMGGISQRDFLNDVWVSRDGRHWSLLKPDAPWASRCNHQSVVFNDRMWVIGGYNGTLLNDVWSSPDGVNWDLETDDPGWSARTHFQAIVFNDHIYLTGGQGSWERLNDVWRSADGANWELVTESAPWRERSHHNMVVHDDKLYLMAGCYFDFEAPRKPLPGRDHFPGHYIYLNDIWVTGDGEEWEMLHAYAPFEPRVEAAVVSLYDHIYLIGGDVNMAGTELERSAWVSEDGWEWNYFRLASTRYRRDRVYKAPVFVHNHSIWIIGGANKDGFQNRVIKSLGRPPVAGTDFERPPAHRKNYEDFR